MRCLIIGGNGYIGSSIATSLMSNHEVHICDAEYFGSPMRDIPQSQTYNYFPCKIQDLTTSLSIYDIILLFAGHSSVQLCNNYPMEAVENNVYVFKHLVDNLSTNQKLIYASSSCVYGTAREAIESTQVKPTDGLSYSKAFMDYIALNCNKKVYGLRLGSVCGWSKNFRKDLAVNSMTVDGLTKRQVFVSNPRCCRSFAAIGDVVLTVKTIMDQDGEPGIYNVASFSDTFGNLAQKIASITGASLNVQKDTGTYDFTVVTDKLIKTYGIKLTNTLEDVVMDITKHQGSISYRPREFILNDPKDRSLSSLRER